MVLTKMKETAEAYLGYTVKVGGGVEGVDCSVEAYLGYTVKVAVKGWRVWTAEAYLGYTVRVGRTSRTPSCFCYIVVIIVVIVVVIIVIVFVILLLLLFCYVVVSGLGRRDHCPCLLHGRAAAGYQECGRHCWAQRHQGPDLNNLD